MVAQGTAPAVWRAFPALVNGLAGLWRPRTGPGSWPWPRCWWPLLPASLRVEVVALHPQFPTEK